MIPEGKSDHTRRDRDYRKTEGHRETGMCARCKGGCCRVQPGHCIPTEFASADEVRAAVVSGKYTIVLLMDENIMARVVRPHYGEPDLKRGCVFLHESGCELPFEERPYGCRALKPREHDNEYCTPDGISIEEAARMWEESGYLPPLSACVPPSR